ncbi:MAG: hypothetical protein K2P81_07250 [Bacteriovoracaceae bacterium]|nr:hypothetical protein [Bacteriovoracaceae bacterium]
MLKKLLIFLPVLGFAGSGFWLWQRVQSNPNGVIPSPYTFGPMNEKIAVDAPLLIIGDRMAERMGLFKESLSLEISTGLSKPIKTAVLAADGFGIHRTIRQLENLDKWPKVLIYTGGSQEFVEDKFLLRQMPSIRRNFKRFYDDRWRTLMMLWPESARVVYDPIVRQVLPNEPKAREAEFTDEEYQARLELSLILFEIELNRLVELAKDHGVVLILMSSPVNLDISPKKTCEMTRTPESIKGLADVRELIRQKDYKAAYSMSRELSESNIGNAEIFFLHGQVSYRVGQRAEAIEALTKAAAFDCKPWRATAITNNIIEKVAQEQRVTFFDFAGLVENDWNNNTTFFDETYPQDLYYEKATKSLGIVLKKMLKL